MAAVAQIWHEVEEGWYGRLRELEVGIAPRVAPPQPIAKVQNGIGSQLAAPDCHDGDWWQIVQLEEGGFEGVHPAGGVYHPCSLTMMEDQNGDESMKDRQDVIMEPHDVELEVQEGRCGLPVAGDE